MKFKPTVLLATFVVALSLLLVTSAAQATPEVFIENGSVIRIENLPVTDFMLNTALYNVDFRFESATEVYGPSNGFDFEISADASLASIAVRETLNAEDNIPLGAGPQGSDQFFIGSLDRAGRVLAIGAQNVTGGFWDDCEEAGESDCILGVAILNPDQPFTYADFTEATGGVPPGKATQISPSGDISDNNPTYTWNAVENATDYELQVGGVILESYTADEANCGDGMDECSVRPGIVLADGSYNWWIRASNDFGNGDWSDGLTITVDTSPTGVPGIARLISPSGDIDDNTPTYTWHAVENATDYELQVGGVISESYTADEADCGDGTGECFVTPATELADGPFNWWIRASNDFGNGEWSNGMSITVDTGTGALPGTATLISPSGDINDNTPTYTWNAVENSTWYQIQVNDVTGNVFLDWFSDDETDCGDGTGVCSLTLPTELADGSASWWIKTYNDVGKGKWSDGLDFTVDTGAEVPPGKATQISPSGNISDNTPTYTWDAVENSTDYQLQVNDSTGNVILKWYTADEADCGDGMDECSVTPETELADGSAKWWIRTFNEDLGGNGPWTDAMSFTVDPDTVDPDVNVILDENDNVTRIENLPVYDDFTDTTTIYNVDFIHGTVTDVYGGDLNFDFPKPNNDETIFVALVNVLNALNDAETIPQGAGEQGTVDFFIGYSEEEDNDFVGIVAVGGENFSGFWDLCKTECLDVFELQTAVTVLQPDEEVTWADFTVAE